MASKDLKEKLAEKVQSGKGKEVVDPRKSMGSLLAKMENQFQRALADTIDPKKFTRIALSLYNNNQNFWACSDVSFLSALMISAQAGLEPNTVLNQAFLIPYNGKITFQLGYKGILELCNRTQLYKKITARCVYKEDTFEFEYGLEDKLIHKPADCPSGDPIYYYAKYELTNGASDFVVWSRDKIINHAKKYSKTFHKNNSAWKDSFDAMALKTCIIDVLKYAPKTTEVARAMAYDNKDQSEVKEILATEGDEDLGIILDTGSAIDTDFTEATEENEPTPEKSEEHSSTQEEIPTDQLQNQIKMV